MFAQLLTAQGRYGEALFQLEQAKGRGLTPATLEGARGSVLFRQGRYDDAESALKRAIDRNEDALASRILLARTNIQRGNEDDAVDVLNDAVGSVSVWPWVAYAQLRERGGSLTEAERARFVATAERPDAGMAGALLHLELGRVDAALLALDQLLEGGDPDLLWLGVDPEWAPLRDDPRFLRRLVRVFER
jgi:tetratricopeptide (TPR) repeat protein